MLRTLVVFTVLSLGAAGPLGGAYAQNGKFSHQAWVGDQALQLNGAGVQRFLWVRLYRAGLYLPQVTRSPRQALRMDGAKRLELRILHDHISAERLHRVWNKTFRRNNRRATVRRLATEIEQFSSMIRAVHKGDVVHLDYRPGQGTDVRLNGETLGTVVGEDFHRALLRVWLGRRPASSGLKRSLMRTRL